MTGNGIGISTGWHKIPLWLKLIGAAAALIAITWNAAGIYRNQMISPSTVAELEKWKEDHEAELIKAFNERIQKEVELQTQVNELKARETRTECKINALIREDLRAAILC